MLLKTTLLRSTMLVGAASFALPAFAQVASSANTATPGVAVEAAPAQAAETEKEITVTGSLIKNPNLVRATPVIVTTAEEIELRQSNVAEDVLREIPGIVPSIGSAVNNGNGGASYVDLRGIGPNRNLVLLDGNRLVPLEPQRHRRPQQHSARSHRPDRIADRCRQHDLWCRRDLGRRQLHHQEELHRCRRLGVGADHRKGRR